MDERNKRVREGRGTSLSVGFFAKNLLLNRFTGGSTLGLRKTQP